MSAYIGCRLDNLSFRPGLISTAAALCIFAGHPIVAWYMRLMAKIFSLGR